MHQPLHLVILAAGAGKRMGQVPKCLIRVNGQTLLERLLLAAAPLKAQQTVIVLGHHAEAIASTMSAWDVASGIHTVINPLPGEDPSASLYAGLQHLQQLGQNPEHRATMVLLADQPLLSTADLQAVWAAYQGLPAGQQVLWPTVHGQPGHPVVMSSEVANSLTDGETPSLKAWRTNHPEGVHLWHSSNTHHTQDLDSPADLDWLRRETGLNWQLPTCSAPNSG